MWLVLKMLDASTNKTCWVVVDYMRINEVTVSEKYTIPNILDLLDHYGSVSILRHLIPLLVPRTEFSVENGHFEFQIHHQCFYELWIIFWLDWKWNIISIHGYMRDIIVQFITVIYEHICHLTWKFWKTPKGYPEDTGRWIGVIGNDVAYLDFSITEDVENQNE